MPIIYNFSFFYFSFCCQSAALKAVLGCLNTNHGQNNDNDVPMCNTIVDMSETRYFLVKLLTNGPGTFSCSLQYAKHT